MHPNPSTTAKAERSATDEASGADTPTRTEVARWRKWLGISLFIPHLVLPVVVLIVVPIFGLPESVNAILIGMSIIGGPDVLLVVAIAMLGKDGVAELMSNFGSLAKRITKWVAATGSEEGAWFDLELVCPELENHLKVVRGAFVRILGRGKDIEHIELEYNLAVSVPIALQRPHGMAAHGELWSGSIEHRLYIGTHAKQYSLARQMHYPIYASGRRVSLHFRTSSFRSISSPLPNYLLNPARRCHAIAARSQRPICVAWGAAHGGDQRLV